MSCNGRFASATEYNELVGAGIDLSRDDQVAEVEMYLDLAASDVHAALAAVGACDCSFSSWALAYLKKLNILDAAVIHSGPCGKRISDDMKRTWLEWLDKQFELIRTGKVPVCEGDTGSDQPAYATIQHSWTVFSVEQLINNERLKSR